MYTSQHDISDERWSRIEELLPGRSGQPGRVAKDNRLFINAMLYIAKTGCMWRDLPAIYGPWDTVYH
ncbi:MAG: transposase [Bacteroidales bacterium]|nr:transposase [Bacteroidales bacterium]